MPHPLDIPSTKAAFHIPTQEEVLEMNVDQLAQLFLDNHLALGDKLDKIGFQNVPYIGAHGTSQEGFDSISADPYGELQLVTTFQKQSNLAGVLTDLYEVLGGAGVYALIRTRQTGKGGLFVFNTEEKGKQHCVAWGNEVKGWFPGIFQVEWFFGGKSERALDPIHIQFLKHFDRAWPSSGRKEGSLHGVKTDIVIRPDKFAQRLLLALPHDELHSYLSDLHHGPNQYISAVGNMIFVQNIVGKFLEVLERGSVKMGQGIKEQRLTTRGKVIRNSALQS